MYFVFALFVSLYTFLFNFFLCSLSSFFFFHSFPALLFAFFESLILVFLMHLLFIIRVHFMSFTLLFIFTVSFQRPFRGSLIFCILPLYSIPLFQYLFFFSLTPSSVYLLLLPPLPPLLSLIPLLHSLLSSVSPSHLFLLHLNKNCFLFPFLSPSPPDLLLYLPFLLPLLIFPFSMPYQELRGRTL